MDEPAGKVLPIYFVADESASMSKDVKDLDRGLVSLLDQLQSEPMAAAKVRFCVIGFNESARCHLDPVDLRDVEQMPKFTASGSTSYANVFKHLLGRIPSDIAKLKSEGYQVNRPAVFFLTDGEPNRENWRADLAELMSGAKAPRPNVLAFGIGAAKADVIREVASTPEWAFITATGTDTGRAIAEFIKALTKSIIASGTALASEQSTLLVQKPAGFLSLDVDIV